MLAIAAVIVALAALAAAWHWRRGRTALPLTLVVLALAACGGGADRDAGTPSATGGLVDLAGIRDLEAQFEQDDGVPRLVLLVSPT